MQTVTLDRSHAAGIHPHYLLTAVDGQARVMFWNGEFWEVTQECRHINGLLEEGLITVDVARGWILLQATSQPSASACA